MGLEKTTDQAELQVNRGSTELPIQSQKSLQPSVFHCHRLRGPDGISLHVFEQAAVPGEHENEELDGQRGCLGE